MLKGIK